MQGLKFRIPQAGVLLGTDLCDRTIDGTELCLSVCVCV
jgi:hypothetical protein